MPRKKRTAEEKLKRLEKVCVGILLGQRKKKEQDERREEIVERQRRYARTA